MCRFKFHSKSRSTIILNFSVRKFTLSDRHLPTHHSSLLGPRGTHKIQFEACLSCLRT